MLALLFRGTRGLSLFCQVLLPGISLHASAASCTDADTTLAGIGYRYDAHGLFVYLNPGIDPGATRDPGQLAPCVTTNHKIEEVTSHGKQNVRTMFVTLMIVNRCLVPIEQRIATQQRPETTYIGVIL